LAEEEEMGKVRIPKEEEVVGVVISMMGGSRVLVECSDGKERLCRIPGKIKRNIWVKSGDYVIVQPWEVESDKKGDIVWRYTRYQAEWLKRKGLLK
jgi:translation initiation factor 1A